jgi:hypothetical protein
VVWIYSFLQFRHQSKKTRERERQYEARQIASEIFGKRKGEIEREREARQQDQVGEQRGIREKSSPSDLRSFFVNMKRIVLQFLNKPTGTQIMKFYDAS